MVHTEQNPDGRAAAETRPAGKHTPGPWRMFAPGDDSRGWSLDYDQDGDASQNGGSSAHMILAADATPVAIAMVPYPFAADDILDANARLIAAAPELLQALEYAISWIEDLSRKNATHQMLDSKLDELRAVIAKAEGR